MRKLLLSLLAAALLIFSVGSTASVYAKGTTPQKGKTNIQLTEIQKKELSGLHKQILQKRKQVIMKYVQYGVLPKEKGEKIIAHMENHYSQMERRGFIPKRHFKKKHCH